MITPVETVPVVILSGYLGAGKTTWINRLLATTSDRLVVIVNDFGSVNIDAALIKQQHDDTIELSNGCICCAMGGSLADVMLDISDRDFQPDAVVIECSGVADPSAVAAHAYLDGFHLAAIVTLVDAVNWSDTAKNSLVQEIFWRQIESADLLALSKLDAIDADTQSRLRLALHERASTIPQVAAHSIPLDQLLSFSAHSPRELAPIGDGPHFSSTTLEVDPTLDLSELRELVAGLPSTVIRVKGIVQLKDETVLVQRVGNRTTVSTTSLAPTGAVIISAD